MFEVFTVLFMLLVFPVIIFLCVAWYHTSKSLKRIKEQLKQVENKLERMASKNGVNPPSQATDPASFSQSSAAPPNIIKNVPKVAPTPKAPREKSKPLSPINKAFNKSSLFSIESIISKLGIALLLIGIGFIIKLGYDSGFISDAFIIMIGYIMGGVLYYLGIYVDKKGRNVLSQVLIGGSVSTFYIATFAAYQGYGIMNSILAFVLLVVTTLFAFFTSVIRNSESLSIIAILGGLFTPFIVGISYLGLYGLGIYIILLAIGSMIIYVVRRYRVLQLSSITGINVILIILINAGYLGGLERTQLSLLILILLVIFNGVEYSLYYQGKETKYLAIVTPILFGALPTIALLQVVALLDLNLKEWGILFGFLAFIYLILTALLYNKRGHTIISDITLSFIGLFGILGIIQSFGGDIRYLAIIALALIFFYVGKRMAHKYTDIIGYIIYGIGYIWAFVALIIQISDGDLTLLQVVISISTILLLLAGALLQNSGIKQLMGTLTIGVYALITVIYILWYFTEDSYPSALITIAFGLLVYLFIILHHRFNLISLRFTAVLSVAPLVWHISLLIFLGIFNDSSLHWLNAASSIIYSATLYFIGSLLIKKDRPQLKVILKLFAYIFASIAFLIDVSILGKYFGYGLLLFGLLPLLTLYLEPQKDVKEFNLLIKIFQRLFITFIVIYSLVIDRNIFNFIHFIVDLSLLVVVYYNLIKLSLDRRIIFIAQTILYMLIIYKNLHMTESGIITLFWAAYGIGHLTYYLYKTNRTLSYFSLGFILMVAIKFVVIDLSSVGIFWKIVTSMAFGIALLLLSYFIAPILDKKDKIIEKSSQ